MSGASVVNHEMSLELSSMICTAVQPEEEMQVGICHDTQLTRKACAVCKRVHPVQTISCRRLVVTLFSRGFQAGCSAGASASASTVDVPILCMRLQAIPGVELVAA